MEIAGRKIGPTQPPYVIAEISCNHGGSLERALEMMFAAKQCGADAVKFQCITADTITIDSDRPEFTIKDGPWKGRNLYQLYLDTATPFEWFPAIADHAANIGMTWFASVFDKTAVDLMVKLNAPAIKIASFEITDLPLIKYAARTDKPLIISTGMAENQEITRAANACQPYRMGTHAMLHCVSGYPTKPQDANLLRLKHGVHYGFINGISDHSTGPEIPIAATALGACIIEKHFRLCWHPDTEDTPFSLNETEFADMALSIRTTWRAMQDPPDDGAEAAHKPLRRSLFAVADIKAGEIISEENVRSIRPGHGLPPIAFEKIEGKPASRDVARGEPMGWDMVEP